MAWTCWKKIQYSGMDLVVQLQDGSDRGGARVALLARFCCDAHLLSCLIELLIGFAQVASA